LPDVLLQASEAPELKSSKKTVSARAKVVEADTIMDAASTKVFINPSQPKSVNCRGNRALNEIQKSEAAQFRRPKTPDHCRPPYHRAPLWEAARIAALDQLNGMISAMRSQGMRSPYGRDPDPFIALMLQQGR
jgi:hypothetical protein